MNTLTRVIAALEMVLIFPAALFMAALAARNLHSETADIAQQIILWYSGRMWTLWMLLLALPFTVLVTGCITLLHRWSPDRRPGTSLPSAAAIHMQPAMLLVAVTTLAAACILVIVVLHMAAN